jgi:hypothetical protein
VSRDFVAVPGVENARALMASDEGHCAFDAQTRALCWSINDSDELSSGAGHTVPISPPSAVEMSQVELLPLVTLFPSLAAVEGGPVLTWGRVNVLGIEPPEPAFHVRAPLAVPGLVDPVRVDPGLRSYCVTQRDGRVFC